MTTELAKDEYDQVTTEIVPVDTFAASEPITIDDNSVTESAQGWRSVQSTATAAFTNATSYTAEFFKNNRQLLTTLGWIFLAFLAARLLFAAVDAIDDIPLVTPILKLIGLVYVVRFVGRYLLRQNDRQQFMRTLNRLKAEMVGN